MPMVLRAARARLAEAQGRVNELMDQGVTSGEEYEAAVAELQAAQAGLAKEEQRAVSTLESLPTQWKSQSYQLERWVFRLKQSKRTCVK